MVTDTLIYDHADKHWNTLKHTEPPFRKQEESLRWNWGGTGQSWQSSCLLSGPPVDTDLSPSPVWEALWGSGDTNSLCPGRRFPVIGVKGLRPRCVKIWFLQNLEDHADLQENVQITAINPWGTKFKFKLNKTNPIKIQKLHSSSQTPLRQFISTRDGSFQLVANSWNPNFVHSDSKW